VFQGTIIDYRWIKVLLYANLKMPETWQIMSRLLNAMMKRDPKLLEAALTQMSEGGGGGGSGITKESLWGIRCSGMTGQTDDIHDIIPILNKRWDTSRFAADTIEDVVMRCSRWKLTQYSLSDRLLTPLLPWRQPATSPGPLRAACCSSLTSPA
jgi:hypothetical protein